jgi:enoyl-CoA hydratase
MDYQYLLLAVDAGVATVTIHRPDKGNALAPAVLEELEQVFAAIAKRQEVNVVVLTGGEKYFSAGFDLNEIRKLQKVSNEAYTAMFHRTYIGSDENHRRIDKLQAELAARKKG